MKEKLKNFNWMQKILYILFSIIFCLGGIWLIKILIQGIIG